MHLDVYKLIWFELGVMIATIKPYILILAHVIVILQDHPDARE